ncbi:MAG: glycine betaine ABC transporter substrate-binding protein [Marmoricola sp.]
MKYRSIGRATGVALTAALGLSLAACGSNPTTTNSGGGSGSKTIVVGSASFGESEVLAEIYAGALNARGIKASTKLNIGQREAYIGALQDGTISLFPEYSGNLLTYFQPKATASSSTDVLNALKTALPSKLEVLTPSAAEDKDSLNVTSAEASKYGLKTIADLKKVPNLKLAANPEFKTRSYGIPGLGSLYGITGITFTAISDGGGPATLKALTSGQVDVADIYSTTSSIVANHLVTLQDPKHLIAAQNVIPLIRKDADTAAITKVLDEVSSKLTTAGLLQLNAQFDGASKPSAAAVAAQWLKANGFS